MSLYELVTRIAIPLPGESKPVYILRRDLKAGLLAAFKKAFPETWRSFDERELNRRLDHWRKTWGKPDVNGELTPSAKDHLITALLGVDVGKTRLAEAMVRPIKACRKAP